MSFLVRSVLLSGVAGLALQGAAQAAEAGSVSEVVVTAPELVSTAGSKSPVSIAETPQSVTVIPAEVYQLRGAQTLQDVLGYSSGVRSDQYGNDARVDSFVVRGSSAQQYLDGLRSNYGFYNSARVDPWALERVEVVKGPASVLYGQGGVGGVVNMTSKLPLFMPRAEFVASYGTHDRATVQFDVSTPLGDKVAVRLVGMIRDADTQTNFIEDKRAFVSPSITFRPAEATELTLMARFQADRTGSTTQFPPHQGTIFPNPNGRLPSDLLVSEPDFERYDANQTEVSAFLRHRFSDLVQYRVNARYGYSDVNYWTMYPNSYAAPLDPWVKPGQPGYTGPMRAIGRSGSISEPENQTYAVDNQLLWTFSTGPIGHTLLTGADLQSFKQKLRASATVAFPALDLYAPVYGNYTLPAVAQGATTSQEQFGVYAQDQLKIGALNLIAGVRYDEAKSASVTPRGVRTEKKDDQVTWRVGVLYTFDNGLAPYVSYSQSFLPVAGANLAGAPFEPQLGRQVEGGIKWQVSPDTLITTAVFDIRDTNRLTPHPTNPADRVQTGEVRTTGFEIEAQARLMAVWSLAAGYTYTDARVSKSNAQGELGKPLASVPKNTAFAWADRRFDIGPGDLRIGAGVRMFGKSVDRNLAGTFVLTTPGYTLVDALVAYEVDRWRFAVNANNLTDKYYYSACLTRGDCFIGARRTVVASLGYRF